MPGVIPLLLTEVEEEAAAPAASTVGGGMVVPAWELPPFRPGLTYLEFLELLGVEDDDVWRLLYQQMFLAN